MNKRPYRSIHIEQSTQSQHLCLKWHDALRLRVLRSPQLHQLVLIRNPYDAPWEQRYPISPNDQASGTGTVAAR
jgi:hypothetical protein